MKKYNCKNCGIEFFTSRFNPKNCSRSCVNKTHGMSKNKIYKTYTAMIQRCNPNTSHKENRTWYADRGIKVCKRWMSSFENFYKDMGDHPGSNYTLDRINNDKGYSKSNCRWATRSEQNSNTRITVFITCKNKTLTLSQWSEKLGTPISTIWNRLNRGCVGCDAVKKFKRKGM